MKFTKKEEYTSADSPNKGKFLTIQSGEHVIGLLRGEICTFYQKFEDGKYNFVPKGTKGAEERYRVNIIVNGDDGKPTAKIFSFGRGLSNMFFQIQEDYGDLERIFIKIRREGEKKQTKWYVSVPKDQPTEGQLEALKAIPLNILDTQIKDSGPKVQTEGLGTMHQEDVEPRIQEIRSKASKGMEKMPGDDTDSELPF